MDKDYLFAPREAGKEMKEVANGEFGGERALFAVENVRLTDCIFHAGESALKRTANIEAIRCRFEGKYPLISLLAYGRVHGERVRVHSGSTRSALVFAQSENERHAGGCS